MSFLKNARFQTKLFVLFTLFSSIPVLLLGSVAFQKLSVMFQEQTEQDLNVILEQLNTSIDRQIGDFDRFSMLPYYLPDIFSFLNKPSASSQESGTAQIEAQRTMARLMSAYPSINSSIQGLMIYGMNGISSGYRINGSPRLNSAVDMREDLWYEEVMTRKGGFIISGVKEVKQFVGSPFPAIIGSRLIMDETYTPLAVIAMFISPDFIPKLVRSLDLPTVQVSVVDRTGKLVYASNAELAERQMVNVPDDSNGTWEIALPANNGGAAYSGVYLESRYSGWTTYLGINRNEMLKGRRSIQNFTFGIVIVLVIAAAFLSWLLARSLSQPIHRMIRSMRDVEKGEFAVPVVVEREDEIGRLESHYGRMVYRLGELVHSIEEKERQKRHAELYALRARIQPHFLYNTLNSIRMLAILQQSPVIAKLIQSLNKLLQANMKLDFELVPLEEEIKLLREYAVLMDLRYTNVFELEWNIPEDTLKAAIPPMLLQPILENAIFHGAKGLNRKLNITVSALITADGKKLEIEIIDDGAGPGTDMQFLPDLPAEEQQEGHSRHIGLRNVQDRIQLRFGDVYGLTANRQEGLTVIRLVMPFKPLDKEGDEYVESSGR